MTSTFAKSGNKVIVSVIAVPLLLLVISLWQGYRLGDYWRGGLARAELMTLNCWPPVV